MVDVTSTDFDVELTLPDGRWIEVYNIEYDAGERGNLSGLPENCWPEVPSSVTFDALVGDSAYDETVKRAATSDEIEAIYDKVLAWCERN